MSTISTTKKGPAGVYSLSTKQFEVLLANNLIVPVEVPSQRRAVEFAFETAAINAKKDGMPCLAHEVKDAPAGNLVFAKFGQDIVKNPVIITLEESDWSDMKFGLIDLFSTNNTLIDVAKTSATVSFNDCEDTMVMPSSSIVVESEDAVKRHKVSKQSYVTNPNVACVDDDFVVKDDFVDGTGEDVVDAENLSQSDRAKLVAATDDAGKDVDIDVDTRWHLLRPNGRERCESMEVRTFFTDGDYVFELRTFWYVNKYQRNIPKLLVKADENGVERVTVVKETSVTDKTSMDVFLYVYENNVDVSTPYALSKEDGDVLNGIVISKKSTLVARACEDGKYYLHSLAYNTELEDVEYYMQKGIEAGCTKKALLSTTSFFPGLVDMVEKQIEKAHKPKMPKNIIPKKAIVEFKFDIDENGQLSFCI